MRALIVTSLCLFAAYPLSAQAPEGYYRDPTIHGETIVFAAEGDLWKVGKELTPARQWYSQHGRMAARFPFSDQPSGPHHRCAP